MYTNNSFISINVQNLFTTSKSFPLYSYLSSSSSSFSLCLASPLSASTPPTTTATPSSGLTFTSRHQFRPWQHLASPSLVSTPPSWCFCLHLRCVWFSPFSPLPFCLNMNLNHFFFNLMIFEIYCGCSMSLYVLCSSLGQLFILVLNLSCVRKSFFNDQIFIMSEKIIFLIVRYDFLYKKIFLTMKENILSCQFVPVQNKKKTISFH